VQIHYNYASAVKPKSSSTIYHHLFVLNCTRNMSNARYNVEQNVKAWSAYRQNRNGNL